MRDFAFALFLLATCGVGYALAPFAQAVLGLSQPQEQAVPPARSITQAGCGNPAPWIWCTYPVAGKPWEFSSTHRFPMGFWLFYSYEPLSCTVRVRVDADKGAYFLPGLGLKESGAYAIWPSTPYPVDGLRPSIHGRFLIPLSMVGTTLWVRQFGYDTAFDDPWLHSLTLRVIVQAW